MTSDRDLPLLFFFGADAVILIELDSTAEEPLLSLFNLLLLSFLSCVSSLLGPRGYHLVGFFLLSPPWQIQAVFPSLDFVDYLFPLWKTEGTAFCTTRGYKSDVVFPQFHFRWLCTV